MKRYFYKEELASIKRGYNRTISVWRLDKEGRWRFIGEEHCNSASWRGAYGVACGILNEKIGHRMADGYGLKSKNITLIQLP